MRNIKTQIALGLFFAGIAIICPVCASAAQRGGDTVTAVELPPGENFTDIDIKTLQAPITVRVAGPNEQAVLQLTNLEGETQISGGKITFDSTRWERGRGNRFFAFLWLTPRKKGEVLLKLPQGSVDTIAAKITSGSIHIENLNTGQMSAVVASGSIRIENTDTQRIDAKVTSGTINLENLHFTEGELKTTSGDININGSGWDSLSTGVTSGNVRMGGASLGKDGGTSVRVTDGRVDIDVLESSDGFTCSFRNTSGSSYINGERINEGRVNVTSGNGSHQIDVTVTSGRINLDFGQ